MRNDDNTVLRGQCTLSWSLGEWSDYLAGRYEIQILNEKISGLMNNQVC